MKVFHSHLFRTSAGRRTATALYFDAPEQAATCFEYGAPEPAAARFEYDAPKPAAARLEYDVPEPAAARLHYGAPEPAATCSDTATAAAATAAVLHLRSSDQTWPDHAPGTFVRVWRC